jgi:hypothetical protein
MTIKLILKKQRDYRDWIHLAQQQGAVATSFLTGSQIYLLYYVNTSPSSLIDREYDNAPSLPQKKNNF